MTLPLRRPSLDLLLARLTVAWMSFSASSFGGSSPSASLHVVLGVCSTVLPTLLIGDKVVTMGSFRSNVISFPPSSGREMVSPLFAQKPTHNSAAVMSTGDSFFTSVAVDGASVATSPATVLVDSFFGLSAAFAPTADDSVNASVANVLEEMFLVIAMKSDSTLPFTSWFINAFIGDDGFVKVLG